MCHKTASLKCKVVFALTNESHVRPPGEGFPVGWLWPPQQEQHMTRAQCKSMAGMGWTMCVAHVTEEQNDTEPKLSRSEIDRQQGLTAKPTK